MITSKFFYRHFICSMRSLSNSDAQEESYVPEVAPRHSCPDGAVEVMLLLFILLK